MNTEPKIPEKDWKQAGALCWVERDFQLDNPQSNGASFDSQQSSSRAFVEGIIIQEYFKKMIRVRINEREEEVLTDRICERSGKNESNSNDMSDLRILNDAELIDNLEKRYATGRIFTFIGPTLLVVNPFRQIDGLVSEENNKLYYNSIIESQAGPLALKSVQPHVYAIAAEAYRSLSESGQKQAIVISGESGAGKTENAKLCMKFLASIQQMKAPVRSRRKTITSGIQQQQSQLNQTLHSSTFSQKFQTIEDKILSCNPVLESFGNAKTAKNDNSSRFGKYVTLTVDIKENKIIGAQIKNYLLEKIRIIQQGQDDNSFHIFYYLLYGATNQQLQDISLLFPSGERMTAQNFNYLQNSASKLKQLDYSNQFLEVLDALEVLELESYKDAVLRILAAVLHLGNIQFDATLRDENHPCAISNPEVLNTVANLLGISNVDLQREITSKQQIVSGIGYSKYHTLEVCLNQRDSIAKELYEQLFNWIVKECNNSLLPKEDYQQVHYPTQHSTIGLLDIYGFEVFNKNGFEQFFINYTNEKLSQLYIQYVFKAEEEIFKEEGLQTFFKKLDFKDNQDVISIMDSQSEPLGIFKLLEDRCKNPAASLDVNLLNDIRKKHGDKEKIAKNPNHKFRLPKKISDSTFIIVHSARDVEYEINGFIEKNKDEVNLSLLKLINKSPVAYLPLIISEREDISAESIKKLPPGKDNLGQRMRQISQKFISEVSALMNELISCNVQFIRCIKPNEEKQPLVMNQRFSLNQIRYLGVLESINVRKQSYPIRYSHKAFYSRFGLMMLEGQKSYLEYENEKADFAPLVQQLFKTCFPNLDEKKVLFGKAKLFLKNYEVLGQIQQTYTKKTEKMLLAVKKIKKKFWSYQKLKQFRCFIRGIRKLQRIYRRYLQFRQSAHVIQQYIFAYNMQQWYQHAMQAVSKIQKEWRIAIIRLKDVTFKRMKKSYVLDKALHQAWDFIVNRATVVIQRMLRGCHCRGVHAKKVLQIRTFTQRTRQFNASMKIKLIARRYEAYRRQKLVNQAAFTIQGWFKMIWLSELLSRLRKATRLIQRNVRTFLIKKTERQKRTAEFLGPIVQNLNKVRISEELHLFNGQSTAIDPPSLLPKEIFRSDRSVESVLEKSHEHFFSARMYLFSYIIDFEILSDTSEIYDPLWSTFYSASFKDGYEKQAYLQHLSVGDTHTLSCSLSSKVHTWGWNDYGQLGVPIVDIQESGNQNGLFSGTQIFSMNVPGQINRIQQISTGSNHNILLDIRGSIWSWGCNSKGQLGQNHYENLDSPTKIICGKNEFCKIEAKGDENYAVTKEGKLFHWPTRGLQGECVNYPLEIILPKVLIKDVGCGHNFAILLTTHGLLYSLGSENNEGELGLGDSLPRKIPTLINSLKDAGEKILQVDCGFKHVICKTSLGKVFTWGWGERGQLGHGGFNNELHPRFLKSPRLAQDKCLQVLAGHKCSFILSDTRKIYHFGTNSTIDHKADLTEFNIKTKSDKLSQSFYEPVRIQSTWSKTLSIVTVTFGNTRKSFEKNLVLKAKTLNNLTAKWTESNIDSIDPPFVDKIANFISEKNMKMPLSRVPDVQFESRKQFQRLKNELQEANYMQLIEEEFETAHRAESYEINGQQQFFPSSKETIQSIQNPSQNFNNQLISPQKQKELREKYNVDWQQENWEEFQQLNLSESVRDSLVELNDQNYFERLQQQQQGLLQENEQHLNGKTKRNHVKVANRYKVSDIPESSSSKTSLSNISSMHGSLVESQRKKQVLTDSQQLRSHSNSMNPESELKRSNVSTQRGKQNEQQQQLQPSSFQQLKNERLKSSNSITYAEKDTERQSQAGGSTISERENKIRIVREKVEELLRIPEDQWSEIDREFMRGAQQLNINNLAVPEVNKSQTNLPASSQFGGIRGEKSSSVSHQQPDKKTNKLTSSKNAIPNNSNNNSSRSKREIPENEEAVLENVKGRWMQLRGLPREEWTQKDAEFMAIVKQNNLEAVFNNNSRQS